MIPVEVVGIRLEVSNQPVLILRDTENSRYLPLWIGTSEATAISIALDGVSTPRPLTHDLLNHTIAHLGAKLVSVTVSELVDGIFYATLNFAAHDSISARPSDAIALAVRSGVPVLVDAEVMDIAGLDITSQDEEIDDQEELERFRAFLDEINPEDF